MIRGRVWKFGHHVDTDIIIPAPYLVSSDPAYLAPHCMEGERPGFAAGVAPGDILLAGENFGCGSSREHAPVCIKATGIACVVATSFARIFYRNAINIGLPVVEAPGLWEATEEGDALKVDAAARKVVNETRGREFDFQPFPPFIEEIIAAGGLMAWVSKKYAIK